MSMMGANGGLSNGKLEMATEVPDEVLAGQTFYAGDKDIKTGSMPNNGAWESTIDPGASVTIPLGFHNGNGKVTAGPNTASYTINMNRGPGITNATTTITFHEAGQYHISGGYSAGWICTTTIACKGVQRGTVSNGNSGSLDFTVDVVPNDTLVLTANTDGTNSGNRSNNISLSVQRLK